MKKRIKSERLIYVRHPLLERLIILFQALALCLLEIPWLCMRKWDFRHYFDSDLGCLGTLFTSLFLVLFVVYVFLNMRPQDHNGKDSSFNFATALALELVRSTFKFLVLGLFAPVTIFLIRKNCNEDEE